MATSIRTFYACQKVQMTPPSGAPGSTIDNTFTTLNAINSLGITTNYNLEPVYQLGQLEPGDQFENNPEVEISITKTMDGTATIYEHMMGDGGLTALSESRGGVKFFVYPQQVEAATGVSTASCLVQPAYLSSITWNFPSDGAFTEEATIVGNSKTWSYGATDNDAPAVSLTGVARRQMFDEGNSVFPNDGISGAMPGDALLQNISVSVDFGREEIYQLGQQIPYTRYINFPVEVTTEFEIISASGDYAEIVEATSDCANDKNIGDQSISIVLCDGTTLDLGSKNRLNSVSTAGGDAGGDNVTYTYSYVNYSKLDYTGPSSMAQSYGVGDFEQVDLKSSFLNDYNSKD